MTRTSSISLLTAIFCLGLAGCGKEAPKVKQTGEADTPSASDNVKVELPSPPDFDEGKVAEKHEDGAWSVYGLRKELDANVKQGEADVEIEVRGFVQDIYEPPVCPEGEQCPPGKQPHVWITDKDGDKGKKRAMMVVNYAFTIADFDKKRWKDVAPVMLEKGKQYTFKGKFKRFSDTGFADARGLLDFVAYKAKDATGADTWVAPPGAPWHPLELAQQEEAQKKLIEKVNKNAGKAG